MCETSQSLVSLDAGKSSASAPGSPNLILRLQAESKLANNLEVQISFLKEKNFFSMEKSVHGMYYDEETSDTCPERSKGFE